MSENRVLGKIFGCNPLKTKLNPICHLLALLGAHHIFHVSGLRVKGHGEMGDWRIFHNGEVHDFQASPVFFQVIIK